MAASSPSKTRKKSTAPRKAATARIETNGTNGAKPELFQPLPKPPEAPAPQQVAEHPYGDKPVYVFKTKIGDPIVFPMISTLAVTAKFMWRIYNLNELFQSFEWMNLAEVPRDIQERVIDLPNVERASFWSGWFADIVTPASAGDILEPPGES